MTRCWECPYHCTCCVVGSLVHWAGWHGVALIAVLASTGLKVPESHVDNIEDLSGNIIQYYLLDSLTKTDHVPSFVTFHLRAMKFDHSFARRSACSMHAMVCMQPTGGHQTLGTIARAICMSNAPIEVAFAPADGSFQLALTLSAECPYGTPGAQLSRRVHSSGLG